MRSPAKLATFLYHDVADTPAESGFQRPSALPYKQTRKNFVSHLEGIANSGFSPRSVPEVDFRKAEKQVLITFDDGGRGALQAAEELNRRGWKGHFFITTSLIGTRTFLDARAIGYLRSCGHVIGSHSHTHPDIFKGISFEQMIREWRTSCDLLSNLLGSPCLAASVPGGDVSRRVFQSAHEAGLKFLFTSAPVLTPRRQGDCWILGRVCPRTDAPLAEIQKLAEFNGWSGMLLRYQAKTMLKTSLFPLYRIYVRHALQHS
jgi:peptidoglycan/xylan/chitin deacetylase (PgdA/CDA1 family)